MHKNDIQLIGLLVALLVTVLLLEGKGCPRVIVISVPVHASE